MPALKQHPDMSANSGRSSERDDRSETCCERPFGPAIVTDWRATHSNLRGHRPIGGATASVLEHRPMFLGQKTGSGSNSATRCSRVSGILRSTALRALRPSVERSLFVHLVRPVRSGPAAPYPDRGAVASLYFLPSQTNWLGYRITLTADFVPIQITCERF